MTNLAFFSSYHGRYSGNYNYLQPPVLFGHTVTDYHCYYTFTQIKRFRSFLSNFDFVTTGLDIIQVQSSPYEPLLGTYCVVSCPVYTFVDYTLSTSACQLCGSYIINCLSCTSKNTCVQCKPIAALVNQRCTLCPLLIPFCASCSNSTQCITCFLGKLVTGGCTTTIGCTFVVQMSSPSIRSVCYACD